jgi:hypothetical protein
MPAPLRDGANLLGETVKPAVGEMAWTLLHHRVERYDVVHVILA